MYFKQNARDKIELKTMGELRVLPRKQGDQLLDFRSLRNQSSVLREVMSFLPLDECAQEVLVVRGQLYFSFLVN